MRPWLAAGYVVAQLLGALAGASTLMLWGPTGREVHFGATLPGRSYGPLLASAGEVVTSAALVVSLLAFVGSARLRRFTPLLFPVIYAVMVYLEAPLSGTSTNPARSLGPALVSGVWRGWWVYWVGPVLGAVVAVLVGRSVWLRGLEVEVAKLYHFEHDLHGLLQTSGMDLPARSSRRRRQSPAVQPLELREDSGAGSMRSITRRNLSIRWNRWVRDRSASPSRGPMSSRRQWVTTRGFNTWSWWRWRS